VSCGAPRDLIAVAVAVADAVDIVVAVDVDVSDAVAVAVAFVDACAIHLVVESEGEPAAVALPCTTFSLHTLAGRCCVLTCCPLSIFIVVMSSSAPGDVALETGT